ncbi:DUF5602 domain-containing protein [Marinobacterium lutimaris]|uniref:TTHB210-like domain-containing protein n=1 Tax=Marinobacterium lutimaris TaxID=568106 RepID=A0A1H6DS13_9GAMM|nr:DUF5602 domain-containing protein [Marinobacterium lutimaris]SEG87486.1 hypothetical protein SAMN05444390_10889 [Marinobacterium lutimaris]
MIRSGLPAPGLVPVAIALTAILAGCSTSPKDAQMSGTFEGPPVAIGQGQAWTFVTLDEQGAARTLGIRFSEETLTGLPTELSEHGAWEYDLELPAEAAALGYDHVMLDWNPHGHIPPGVYDTPHFDFHFYAIDHAARKEITLDAASLEMARKAPEEGYMPAGYALPPGTEVPNMGAHAIDPASGEFNGEPFTTTFIYGFYDGKVIFMEPMMTLDYLKSRPDMSMPVKQPQAYHKDFAYPTSYGVHFDAMAKRYEVTLDGLARY